MSEHIPDNVQIPDNVKENGRRLANKARHAAQEYGQDLYRRLPDLDTVTQQLGGGLNKLFVYASPEEADRMNQQKAEKSLTYYREHRDEIGQRLTELQQEWDADRVMQAVAGGGIAAGLWFSMTKSRLFLLLSMALAAGQIQYATKGRNAAYDLIRRAGFRSRNEIEEERTQLRALRGDFREAE